MSVGSLDTVTQSSIAGELGNIRLLLEAVLGGERADVTQIVVSNFTRREAVLRDNPAPRSKRLLIGRQGTGGDGTNFPLVAGAGNVFANAVELVRENEGRLGGVISNAGATNGAILYLCNQGDLKQASNRPAIYLPPNGVWVWDFLLGPVLYGGPVWAVAAASTTSVTVAEY